jgi:AcrR family transcriptional regulator
MMDTLTPRERRHQKTKQAILQAAHDIITEKGADGLSLREIANRIDYSPAGLYEYFDGKDDIMASVCMEGLEQFSKYLNRVPANLAPAERLIRLGLAYLDFARNNSEQFTFIFTRLPQKISLAALSRADTPYHILRDAVEKFVKAEQVVLPASTTIDTLAYILWAKMHGMAMLQQSVIADDELDTTFAHRWAFESFVNGLKPI